MERAPTEKPLEICILAGGLSSRMSCDKSKLRLGGTALLAHIRRTAKTLNVPVRVIRSDLVPRCGPMGGIYTALKTTSAETVLFLACDMPQVSGALLKKVLQHSKKGSEAVFTWNNQTAGFPFVLNCRALPLLEKLLAGKHFSLQILARKSRAKEFHPGHGFKSDLVNVNTPADWIRLKENFAEKNSVGRRRGLSIGCETLS